MQWISIEITTNTRRIIKQLKWASFQLQNTIFPHRYYHWLWIFFNSEQKPVCRAVKELHQRRCPILLPHRWQYRCQENVVRVVHLSSARVAKSGLYLCCGRFVDPKFAIWSMVFKLMFWSGVGVFSLAWLLKLRHSFFWLPRRHHLPEKSRSLLQVQFLFSERDMLAKWITNKAGLTYKLKKLYVRVTNYRFSFFELYFYFIISFHSSKFIESWIKNNV